MKFVPAVARLLCLALPGSFLTMFCAELRRPLYYLKECQMIPSSTEETSREGGDTSSGGDMSMKESVASMGAACIVASNVTSCLMDDT